MAEYYVHHNSSDEQARIRRFVGWAVAVAMLIALLLMVFILAARWWLPLIPFTVEKRVTDNFIGLLLQHTDPADPVLADYLAELGDTLSAQQTTPGEFPVTVHLVNEADANAFATLGGHVFVYRGLLQSLETENALAMVLAHEFAHVANRDPLVSIGRAVLLSVLLYSVTGQGRLPANLADLGGELALLSYSREQEQAADLAAQETLQRVYGHVGGASTFFAQMLSTDSDAKDSAAVPNWISSHPHTSERINALRAQAAKSAWVSGPQTAYPRRVRDAL